MPFPKSQRIIYKNNPLQEVVCQLRYPRIMQIESTSPADFQDRIRQEYPLSEQKIQNLIPSELNQFLSPDLIKATSQGVSRQAYDFFSKDKEWQVGLTSEFVSLVSYNYVRWGEFFRRIGEVTEALTDTYQPGFYSRVGLRFVNVIEKEMYGFQNSSWKDLINPSVVGLFASNELLDDEIEASTQRTTISLGNEGSLTTRLGLAKNEKGKTAFVIDNDFFAEGDISDVRKCLEEFHKHAGHVFRYCTTERLRQGLEPLQD